MLDNVTKGKATREEIITAIELYINKNGFSPSVRELAELVGLKSASTVCSHLEKLKLEGRINWSPLMPRTIRVLK